MENEKRFQAIEKLAGRFVVQSRRNGGELSFSEAKKKALKIEKRNQR